MVEQLAPVDRDALELAQRHRVSNSQNNDLSDELAKQNRIYIRGRMDQEKDRDEPHQLGGDIKSGGGCRAASANKVPAEAESLRSAEEDNQAKARGKLKD